MTQDWSVPVWGVLVAVGGLLVMFVALGLVIASARRRVEAQMAQTQRAAEVLAGQIEALERRLAGPVESSVEPEDDRADYIITRIGDLTVANEDEPTYDPLPRAVFADLLLRETAVRAAGLSAGLRRALAPETRNRIRFEMKQEVKRSRKQRKADLRLARREWEAKQRAAGAAGVPTRSDSRREQTA